MSISRKPLRTEVTEEVLRRVVMGAIPVGVTINEAQLADSLGISRTPLREALLGLEKDGLLESRQHKGFRVAPLTIQTVQEVYPIVCALETLAIESTSKNYWSSVEEELNHINGEFKRAADPWLAQGLDDRWHRLLAEGCGNTRLLDLLAGLKRVVHRYEYAYMTNEQTVPISATEHDDILLLLIAGDLGRATKALRGNWYRGIELLTNWLQRS